MFDYNSKEINETWNEISVNNNTAFTIDDAVTMTSHYSKAGNLMMLVLLGNLLSYIIGVLISNPAWVDQIIDSLKKDRYKYEIKCGRIKLIFFKVFRYFSKLMWPFLIVLPHEFLTGIEWCICSRNFSFLLLHVIALNFISYFTFGYVFLYNQNILKL